METTVQKKVAKSILVAASEVFQKEITELYPTLISIGNVKVTADLQLARIYISCLPDSKIKEVMNFIELEKNRIKFLIHSRLKNKLRKMPDFEFYIDDTIAETIKVEGLMEKVKEEENKIRQMRIEKGLNPDNVFDESIYKDLD